MRACRLCLWRTLRCRLDVIQAPAYRVLQGLAISLPGHLRLVLNAALPPGQPGRRARPLLLLLLGLAVQHLPLELDCLRGHTWHLEMALGRLALPAQEAGLVQAQGKRTPPAQVQDAALVLTLGKHAPPAREAGLGMAWGLHRVLRRCCRLGCPFKVPWLAQPQAYHFHSLDLDGRRCPFHITRLHRLRPRLRLIGVLVPRLCTLQA